METNEKYNVKFEYLCDNSFQYINISNLFFSIYKLIYLYTFGHVNKPYIKITYTLYSYSHT